MAPKSPWNKKSSVFKDAQKSDEQANAPAINYGLVQSEEVEVLSAIYMEDFEQVELRGAWRKLTDRSFRLTLRSFSDPESLVKLSVRLTATYPKSAPLLEVEGLDVYHERTQTRIRNIIQNRPHLLLGEVMIHAIASEVQEALEDAVIARQQGTLPSLEEERASAEEVANALAKEAEQAETKRKREAQEEEDRVLKAMVDEELSRREKRKSLKQAVTDESTRDNTTWERVSFDQPAFIQADNNTFQYSSVVILSILSHRQDEDLYLGQPILGGATTTRPLVAVKKLITRKSREKILEFEKALETLSKLRHNNLLSLFTYRIDRMDSHRSQVTLCSAFADRGTLHDLLELGNLHTKKARQFTIELLEALEYLHHHGVVHGEVSSAAIYLVGAPTLSPKLGRLGQGLLRSTSTTLYPKWQSPDIDASSSAAQRKSDIWDLGVVAVQMLLGVQALSDYQGPYSMLGRLNVSDAFDDFMRKVFTIEAKKRPSAFELLPVEFLRTDAAVLEDSVTSLNAPSGIWTRKASSSGYGSPVKRRSRHNSSSVMEAMTVSRYSADFVELGRLGRGGFGEVVKARNKLDGGVYAVKKVKQAPQLLDQVLSEVMLLNRLNHPYVVRYFSTWVENDISGASSEEDTITTANTTTGDATEEESSDGPPYDFGFQSAGGLDFVSSSGYPQIEFDDDDVDADDEECDSSELDTAAKDGARPSNKSAANDDLNLKRLRSESHRLPSIIYIQMEFCERHTLRDLVRKGIASDEAWRFVRQIIEGLAHIHSHGIIHRDLKPENVFVDMASNLKIGDFGLATTSQYHYAERAAIMSGQSGEDMTRSVGTTLYVAPELRSASGGSCTEKVDMYSLGIMFYEMCEHFSTGMERITALQLLRQSNFELPQPYRANGDKSAQGKLIACLIAHKPSERPSSTELLRSDMIPIMVEDETIRQALSGLSDPRSPHHRALMGALFALDSSNAGRVKALAWDTKWVTNAEDSSRLRLRSVARCILEGVFRRHGAEETRRESIFPRSGYYTDPKVVQLLDSSGNLLQLPYDLTLPNARYLARHMPKVKRSFVFGAAYRDSLTGGPPNVFEEVDFDIVQCRPEEEPSLDDAEMLKVTDEIFCEMPTFSSGANVCFHLNHSLILDVILDHCRVPLPQQATVKETISRLGFLQCTWPKIRTDLRKFGLPDTTLEDLEQFDFRDVPKKAFDRLRQLFDSSSSRSKYKLEQGIRSLSEILSTASQFNMQRRIYIVPLGSVNAKFYEDGMLFQCVLERKSNKVVIAAGGRYDSLIQAHHAMHTSVACHGAVGVAIGLDPITAYMSKNSEESQGKSTYLKASKKPLSFAKRCDVLVESSGSEGSTSTAIKILESIWASNISAELAIGVQTSEPGASSHLLIVEVRHEASTTVRVTNTSTGEEDDIPSATLLSHLRQTLRDFESTKLKQPTFVRQTSHAESGCKGNVQVLMAQHRSKKSNKFHIVAEAQQRWSEMVDSWKCVPILAVETRDDVMELFRETRLGDTESWRKVVQRVSLNERQYVQQVQDILNSWRKGWLDNDGAREACVFNFRTGQCIYYDLGL